MNARDAETQTRSRVVDAFALLSCVTALKHESFLNATAFFAAAHVATVTASAAEASRARRRGTRAETPRFGFGGSPTPRARLGFWSEGSRLTWPRSCSPRREARRPSPRWSPRSSRRRRQARAGAPADFAAAAAAAATAADLATGGRRRRRRPPRWRWTRALGGARHARRPRRARCAIVSSGSRRRRTCERRRLDDATPPGARFLIRPKNSCSSDDHQTRSFDATKTPDSDFAIRSRRSPPAQPRAPRRTVRGVFRRLRAQGHPRSRKHERRVSSSPPPFEALRRFRAPEDFSSLTRWTTTNGDMQFNPAEHSDPSWRPDHLDDPIAERARRRSQIAEPAGTGEFAVGGWAGVLRCASGGRSPGGPDRGRAGVEWAPRTSSGRWASLWWWTRPRRLRRSRTATAAPWRTCWRRWRGMRGAGKDLRAARRSRGRRRTIRAAGGRAPAARRGERPLGHVSTSRGRFTGDTFKPPSSRNPRTKAHAAQYEAQAVRPFARTPSTARSRSTASSPTRARARRSNRSSGGSARRRSAPPRRTESRWARGRWRCSRREARKLTTPGWKSESRT